MPFHRVIDFLADIIEENHFHHDARIVDGDRLSASDTVTESSDCAVVFRLDPFAEHVLKTIDIDRNAGFLTIAEHQLFPGKFAAAVFRVAETAGEGRLNRGCDEDGGLAAAALQRVKEDRGKAEVSLHELTLFFRSVHACGMDDEISLRAEAFELLPRIGATVFKDLIDPEIRSCPVLSVADRF